MSDERFSDGHMRHLRTIYADEFGDDQIDAYDRWVRAEALREAADATEDYITANCSDEVGEWLRARADAEEKS